MIIVLMPRLAHAASDRSRLCGLSEIGSLTVGTISMVVDFGLTANAIVKGASRPNHPDADGAKAQIALMVPQTVLTGIGVIFNARRCPDRKAAIISEAIPLVFSIALLGHGIWSLRAADEELQAQLRPARPVGYTSSATLRLLPGTLGPGSVGLRLQSRF